MDPNGHSGRCDGAALSRRTLFQATRRSAMAAAMLALGADSWLLFSGRRAAAASTALTITSYGGSFQQAIQQDVVAPFEKQTGSTVSIVTSTGINVVSRLQLANGKNPGIDVAYLDPVPLNMALRRNLIQKLDLSKIPHAKELYPLAVDPQGYWLGYGIAMTGIVYNTERLKTRPASWLDLWNPEYSGHLAMPYITQTGGYSLLAEIAKLHGGNEKHIDPGFEAMKKLKPHVVAFYKRPDEMARLLTSGDAWLGPWYNDRYNALKKSGAPVGFVRPKEGALGGVGTVSIPVGAANPGLATRYIDFFLSANVLGRWAADIGQGPTNRNVKLPPSVASMEIPYGSEAVGKLAKLDYETISAQLPTWISRWQKEIAA